MQPATAKGATSGMFGLALTLVVLGVWIYSIMDIVTTPADEVRFLPKLLWLLLVILFVVAAFAWLLFGRPRRAYADDGLHGQDGSPSARRRASWGRPGSGSDGAPGPRMPRTRARRPPARPLAPDDDPDFLRELSERIRRGQGEGPTRG